MKKSDIESMPEYFDRYINLVANVELSEAFDDSLNSLEQLDKNLLEKLVGKKYAPDKWTANEIFQHLIDWERIFCFRALIIARKEGSVLQSIDENKLAADTGANNRTTENLIDELKIVRRSTKALFESFNKENLQTAGKSGSSEMSVLAIGFTLLGHQIHHLKILEERYYPLVETELNFYDRKNQTDGKNES